MMTLSASLGVAASVCALFVWRRRAREREVLVAVWDEVNRWQAEIEAAIAGRPAPSNGGQVDALRVQAEAADRAQRVLVVDNRCERRQAIADVLSGLGIDTVFADSEWAAEAAAREAHRADAPYDLILVGMTMGGVEGAAAGHGEHLDAAELARLLAAGGQIAPTDLGAAEAAR
jgi:CheY-like chemotaxis protein